MVGHRYPLSVSRAGLLAHPAAPPSRRKPAVDECRWQGRDPAFRRAAPTPNDSFGMRASHGPNRSRSGKHPPHDAELAAKRGILVGAVLAGDRTTLHPSLGAAFTRQKMAGFGDLLLTFLSRGPLCHSRTRRNRELRIFGPQSYMPTYDYIVVC